MLDDAGEIAKALAGTELGGRPVAEVAIVGADEVAFGVECGPDEVLVAWEAARSVLPVTGRWPLVVGEWDGFMGDDWLERLAAQRQEDLRLLAELRYATGDHTLGRAEYTVTVPTPEAALADSLESLTGDPVDLDGIRWALATTARLYGTSPTEDEVVAAVGEAADPLALERWLLDWEVGRAPPGRRPSTDYLDWTDRGGPLGLVLLPVANGWDTLVHFDLYGSGGALGGTGRLIAVVRSWHERFGAELVANWGTMLQFVVARPPQTLDQAFQLAIEQIAVAPCTTRLTGVPVRHHAQALLGRRSWFLHERP